MATCQPSQGTWGLSVSDRCPPAVLPRPRAGSEEKPNVGRALVLPLLFAPL